MFFKKLYFTFFCLNIVSNAAIELNKKAVRISKNGPINLTVDYLVVIDISVYNDQMRLAQSNNKSLVYNFIRAYFNNYVNGINEIFKTSFLNDPDLRITVKLADILILTEIYQCDWSNSQYVGVAGIPTHNGKQVINADRSLSSFTTYMNSLRLNFTFDHAVGFLNKDLWINEEISSEARSKLVGYSKTGSICTNQKYSLVEEIGAFANIGFAAQQLAHNLGAYFDGLNISRGGDKYSGFCQESDNNLMSPTLGFLSNNLQNEFKLSFCSIVSIKTNLLASNFGSINRNAFCLVNGGNEISNEFTNAKPGHSFTANDQCQMLHGSDTSLCQFNTSNVCSQLICRTPSLNFSCIASHRALEGTLCSEGKECIQGKCVAKANQLPATACPFGDDLVVNQEIPDYLKSMGIFLQTDQMTCDSALTYLSTLGIYSFALCSDAYFKKVCCKTCKIYDNVACRDKDKDCPKYSQYCSASSFKEMCPRTCSVCTGVMSCSNSSYLCKNGASCANIETKSKNDIIGFQCNCAPGYSGLLCEIKNPCIPNPCQNDALCQKFGSLGFICLCKPKYSGQLCSGYNYESACLSNPCKNGGFCSTLGDSYTCSCPSNFTGNICETYDPCKVNPCLNSGICQSIDNNSYYCSCSKYFFGANCQTLINICSNNSPCLNGATCIPINTGDGYTCKCAEFYNGSICQTKLIDGCTPSPCLNNGNCSLSGSSFTCTCQSNYTGTLCQKLIQTLIVVEKFDYCATSPCLNKATCTNYSNTYQCKCTAEFTGKNCETPIKIINSICSPNPCENNALCIASGQNYTCTCQSGYSGTKCQLFNLCINNPCLNQGTCVSIAADTAGCQCKSGYTGSLCQTKNICFSKPCQNNATCSTFNNQYVCTCTDNYSGKNCELSLNSECKADTCLNNGLCSIDSITKLTKCRCTSLYTGAKCESFLNPCFDTMNKPVCFNNGFCSINILKAPYYQCTCKSGFIGTNCQLEALTSQIKTTTKLITNCVDKNVATCQYYSKYKLCSDYNTVNGMSVNDYCPKTCQICGVINSTPQPCIDSYSNCVLWSLSQYCSKLPDPTICRKSCNLC